MRAKRKNLITTMGCAYAYKHMRVVFLVFSSSANIKTHKRSRKSVRVKKNQAFFLRQDRRIRPRCARWPRISHQLTVDLPIGRIGRIFLSSFLPCKKKQPSCRSLWSRSLLFCSQSGCYISIVTAESIIRATC